MVNVPHVGRRRHRLWAREVLELCHVWRLWLQTRDSYCAYNKRTRKSATEYCRLPPLKGNKLLSVTRKEINLISLSKTLIYRQNLHFNNKFWAWHKSSWAGQIYIYFQTILNKLYSFQLSDYTLQNQKILKVLWVVQDAQKRWMYSHKKPSMTRSNRVKVVSVYLV